MPFASLSHEQYAIPLQIAEKIAREPNNYPSALVALAEGAWQREVARNAIAVATLAERQLWFGKPEQDTTFQLTMNHR
jgi:hypothetical protein